MLEAIVVLYRLSSERQKEVLILRERVQDEPLFSGGSPGPVSDPDFEALPLRGAHNTLTVSADGKGADPCSPQP